jgi:hypothetical protein
MAGEGPALMVVSVLANFRHYQVGWDAKSVRAPSSTSSAAAWPPRNATVWWHEVVRPLGDPAYPGGAPDLDVPGPAAVARRQ